MKQKIYLSIILLMGSYIALTAFKEEKVSAEGYVLEHEQDIRKEQAGPHDGGGNTIAFPFFEKSAEKLIFRKRVLQPGSSIGYHLQKWEEIYYIVEGKGTMKMNGKTFPVSTGDAILTHPGNWHGLTPDGDENLTVIINYEKSNEGSSK